MSRCEIPSRRLRRTSFLEGGKRLLGVGVIRIQIERDSQLFFSFFQFAGAEIHPSEILMQMPGLRARSTKLQRLLNLGEGLRPVLRVGRREREIAKLLHAIRYLLVLLQLVVAILILPRFDQLQTRSEEH